MIGSLFSGYGGLDLAVEALGYGPVAWHCEVEPAPAKVLAHHWPHVPNLGDITAVDWTQVAPVDVLCGGFPCQDISNAGKRAGIDGARSGLWSCYADAVRVLRPRLVLVENVGALLARGMGRVLGDLAALGYDARWCSVRASDAGAPHRRERIFITAADTERDRRERWTEADSSRRTDGSGPRTTTAGHRGDVAAHADGVGSVRGGSARRRGHGPADDRLTPADPDDRTGSRERARALTGVGGAPAADPVSHAVREQPVTVSGRGGPSVAGLAGADAAADTEGDGWHEGRPESAWLIGRSDAAVSGAPIANTDGDGLARIRRLNTELRDTHGRSRENVAWGAYEPAIRRWEHTLGRPAPRPTEPGVRGGERLSPRFVEWMMGAPEGHVTAVPGITRNEQLKMLGNGVVVQQAVLAFAHLLSTEVVA